MRFFRKKSLFGSRARVRRRTRAFDNEDVVFDDPPWWIEETIEAISAGCQPVSTSEQ